MGRVRMFTTYDEIREMWASVCESPIVVLTSYGFLPVMFFFLSLFLFLSGPVPGHIPRRF